MDILSSSKCYDVGVEELGFIHQWEMDPIELLLSQQDYTVSTLVPSQNDPPYLMERFNKLPKTSSWGSCMTDPGSGSPSILSFGNQDSPGDNSSYYGTYPEEILLPHGPKRKYEAATTEYGMKKVKVETKQSSCNKEHILAERKRREKLSERFIALSAIIPGLKKMDKASVLADALRYVKDLQQKVKVLEEQTSKKKMESATLVKKVKHPSAEAEENNPRIEARISGKMVYINLQCGTRKGVVVRVLQEIEKLDLVITNTSVIPFTASTIDITVVAQMEDGVSVSAKEMVKKLNSALKQFM